MKSKSPRCHWFRVGLARAFTSSLPSIRKMSDDTEQRNEAGETPEERKVGSFLPVYLVSLILIVLGLSVISWRVAMVLGAVLMPAHAIAIGLVSRVKPWRPPLLKIWPITAFVIALLFLMPGHVIYRMALAPEAVFKRIVANPVPKSVENIEKKEGSGRSSWVSLTFDSNAETIAELLGERDYESVANLTPELQEMAGRFQFEGAHAFQLNFEDRGIRLSAIVNARSNRMCVIYERGLK